MVTKLVNNTGLSEFAVKIKESVPQFGESSSGQVSKSLIDLFYPVGSYYETSNTSFNPNTAWGGTWVEDTGGRVTLAANSSYTTGATGGATSNSHYHQYGVGHGEYYGSTAGKEIWAWNGQSDSWVASTTLDSPSQQLNSGLKDTSSALEFNRRTVKTNTDSKSVSTMQPYIVVKRWHRTA